MGRRCRRGQWLVVAAMLISGCSATGPGVVAREATPLANADDGAIAVDPEVRILTLANGLTVYLRSNEHPGGSAEMRLVINAGSGQENADQSGTAHFLEHMLFNGTTKFPANDLIATLRGFGMQFGADVNAFTSYDETVYELTVPTSESSNVPTGLDVLREWLAAATLDPQQVENEKGVVLDEWRQRDQSLDGRVGEASEALLLDGSGYEGRQPIGSDTAINAMTPELLRRFYDQWYRPDNAAVVVVGDIDADEVEASIRERFEPLAARTDQATSRADPKPATYGTPAATVHTDPDATTGDVEITLPRPYDSDITVARLRQDTLLTMAFDMISTRLNDDVSRGTAPFTSAGVDNFNFVRHLDAPAILLSGEPSKVTETLDAATEEFERVRRFGFSDGEIERAMRAYRSQLQAQLDGSATTQDADFAGQYVDNFLVGKPISSADTAFQIYSSIYDGVTADAVGTAFNDLLTTAALHVMVIVPDDAVEAPVDDDVLARIAALPELDIAARDADVATDTKLMIPPNPIHEASSVDMASDDGFVAPTLLTFGNGARVVLNPTSIADNDVFLSATSPGGLSLVADADVPDALNAVAVVTSSGVGDLDAVQLDTVLSGANIQLYPDIGASREDFVGMSTTDDLELLLQLVNLFMTAPRFDPVALDSTIRSEQAYVDDPTSDPDLAEYIAYAQARFGDEPRYRAVLTPDELAGLDLDGIERVWRSRFSNAGDWVFALSGDFDLETATDLARRYVGSLPGTTSREHYEDFQIDPPSTVITKEVHAGTGDKGSLTFDWNAPQTDPETDGVYADVLSSVLNIRLTDHIREELGASYSPSANVFLDMEPDQLVESYLNITGDPTKIAETSGFVIDDITELTSAGPSSTEFDAAIAELRNTYQYFDNQTLSDVLAKAPDAPELLSRFNDRASVLDDVTPAALQAFIERVMPLDRYIEVRTVPA